MTCILAASAFARWCDRGWLFYCKFTKYATYQSETYVCASQNANIKSSLPTTLSANVKTNWCEFHCGLGGFQQPAAHKANSASNTCQFFRALLPLGIRGYVCGGIHTGGNNENLIISLARSRPGTHCIKMRNERPPYGHDRFVIFSAAPQQQQQKQKRHAVV